MKNGVIMEIKTDYCIVLSQGEYIKLKTKEHSEIGMKIIFLKEDLYVELKQEKTNSRWLRYTSVAAALVMFIVLGMIYYVNNLMVFSIVTVDINPSVELQLNRHNEVISLEAMNNDGEELLNIDIKGQTIDRVLSLLVEEAYIDGFIDDSRENYVMVTTVPLRLNEDLNKELKSLIEVGIKEDKTLQSINIGIIESNIDELKKAGDTHIPLGLIAVSDESDLTEINTVRDFFEDGENLKQFEEKNRMIYRYRAENGLNVELENRAKDDGSSVKTETKGDFKHKNEDKDEDKDKDKKDIKISVQDRDRDRITDYESSDAKVALSDYIVQLESYDSDNDEILAFIILAKDALLDNESDFEELKEVAKVYIEELQVGKREQNRNSNEAGEESDDDSNDEQIDDIIDDEEEGHYGQGENRGKNGKNND